METIAPRGRFTGPILPRFILRMEMSTHAKYLYTLLCDFAGDKDHCWPSQTRLAGMLSCSVSSVKKYLRELTAHDLITIRRTSFHASTCYILRPKNAALFSRPQEPKFAYPQANSGYDKNFNKEEIKDPPFPPREAQRPSGTPRAHKRLRRGGGFFAANNAFESFWAAYPKKEAKELARSVWHRLWRQGVISVAVLTEALRRFRETDSWNREGGRYVPQLVNWLRGRRWLDELDDTLPSSPAATGATDNDAKVLAWEAAQRQRRQADPDLEAARPQFDAFLARFQDGDPRGPAWGLWAMLRRQGMAPSAADVPESTLSPLAFLNQWRMAHAQG